MVPITKACGHIIHVVNHLQPRPDVNKTYADAWFERFKRDEEATKCHDCLFPEMVQRRKEENERREREHQKIIESGCNEPLKCDKCGLQFGWVYSFDLEGSYFNCMFCRANP